MRPALGGQSCRGLLSERLLASALSRLTLIAPPNAAARRVVSTRSPTSSNWTCLGCRLTPRSAIRSSSSNSQWKSRQSRDPYARTAKVQGLKSRAAYKLIEMDAAYRLFRRNQTIVDLGYAPGSWSQVAIERTKPHGVVVGIDLIPAQPPRGVTSIQGNFLSPHVRRLLKEVLLEQVRRKRKERNMEKKFEALTATGTGEGEGAEGLGPGGDGGQGREARTDGGGGKGEVVQDRLSYIDLEKQASHDIEAAEADVDDQERMVDVVMSDLCEPWMQTTGFRSNTLSRRYRLMNTSGINFRDHVLSMDLCYAALSFASENLKDGGHFVCKFYQGAEDKLFQSKLQKMFDQVKREKPESSRKDSKEAYFVALKRKGDVTLAKIEGR
ncbi:FtsJ-domain-containing protein [Cryphonectria parasitica EP155]|uniref:rRNA methyltransferase 2, mitochondrial n=1 Tax=Cryphonectria parasitica (strain ATCC 38755 / EP155) TaxID=660469 RepID=A0A9P4XSV1_CRYP1|nr:FtsJ-domain-containing protein [Cryphonectria parasitica EP155]KAF3760689.1 FtsJ-domain-containing protein [Cryphonectria parasitica EP155]